MFSIIDKELIGSPHKTLIKRYLHLLDPLLELQSFAHLRFVRTLLDLHSELVVPLELTHLLMILSRY